MFIANAVQFLFIGIICVIALGLGFFYAQPYLSGLFNGIVGLAVFAIMVWVVLSIIGGIFTFLDKRKFRYK